METGIVDAQRDKLVSEIAALLDRAKYAHIQFEEEILKRPDDDWPGWYAGYLLHNGLPDLLGGMPGYERLEMRLRDCLTEADVSYQVESPHQDWNDYYARYFLSIALGEEDANP